MMLGLDLFKNLFEFMVLLILYILEEVNKFFGVYGGKIFDDLWYKYFFLVVLYKNLENVLFFDLNLSML